MAITVLVVTGAGAVASDAPDNSIEKSFFPYGPDGSVKPVIADLPPGSVLSKDNWQRGADVLPPELLEKVKSGELQIRVQETTNLPLTPAYIEATRRYAGSAKLDADGDLQDYVAGRPFPVIDASDPQAGLKMAWNDRYRDFGNAAEAWGTFRTIEQSGQVAREIEFYYAIAYGMHRTDEAANQWTKDGILYKEFYKCLGPLDLKNLMNLKYRHDDDRKADIDWSYLPQTRKVKRLLIRHDEPTMGSELLHEDFYGFSGYIHAHDWKVLGRKVLLVPGAIRAPNATVTAQSYPADPWELRDTLILESTPNDASHPYGKRVLYIDAQLGISTYVLIYDKQGKHYKTLFTVYGNPAFSPGNEQVRVPLWLGDSAVNHETGQSSVAVLSRVSFASKLPEELFDVDTLVERGR
jgi:hypothetical protein